LAKRYGLNVTIKKDLKMSINLPSRQEIFNYLRYPKKDQDKLNFYIDACNTDLYYGPRESSDEDQYIWKGFKDGIKQIQGIIDDDIDKTLYYDNDSGEILDKLPEGEIDKETGEYIEPFLEEIYELDIKNLVFGKELKSYI
jgi:hypothetical protein